MVGDSEADVAAARGAGCPVIVVPFGYTETPAPSSAAISSWTVSPISTTPSGPGPPAGGARLAGAEPLRYRHRLLTRALRAPIRPPWGRVAQRESTPFTRVGS